MPDRFSPAQRRYLLRRTVILARTKQRHLENSRFPAYRELVRIRKQICNLKRSIELYREKISTRQSDIASLKRQAEVFELEWGAERARRKRQGKRHE